MTRDEQLDPQREARSGGPEDPDWHPWMPEAISVSSWDEVRQILTSPSFEVFTCSPGSHAVWGGVITTSSGESHLRRRRYLSPLVSRSAMARFDVEVLDRAITHYLVDHPRSQEPVDLISLVWRMLVPVIAGLVGIDGIMGDEARTLELVSLVERFNIGGPLLRYATVPTGPLVADALQAIDEFRAAYFRPSRERRTQLLSEHRAGSLAIDELPNDLLMRQLLPEGAPMWDDDRAVREALTLLAGGISTSAGGVAKVLDNYFRWPGRSPQDADDPELIRAVVNETLRLDPVVEFLPRRAVREMTLHSGRQIKAGTEIVANLYLANRDPAVFGPDAAEFRPDRFRELPSSHPHYGMAFGAGAHLCIGKPLVTLGGADSPDYDIQRILPKILTALLVAGVQPAAGEQPSEESTYRRMLRTYPVVFPELVGGGR